jgi:hypothetical protein
LKLSAFVAGGGRGGASDLVGTRERFSFLDFHGGVATFESAVASLVAEHFGATLLAHVTLTKHVSHLMNSSLRTAWAKN